MHFWVQILKVSCSNILSPIQEIAEELAEYLSRTTNEPRPSWTFHPKLMSFCGGRSSCHFPASPASESTTASTAWTSPLRTPSRPFKTPRCWSSLVTSCSNWPTWHPRNILTTCQPSRRSPTVASSVWEAFATPLGATACHPPKRGRGRRQWEEEGQRRLVAVPSRQRGRRQPRRLNTSSSTLRRGRLLCTSHSLSTLK